jgi:putative DNA primase/helicase
VKADQMLVLEGAQGIGKSRLLATLGGEFHIDDMPDLTSKDAQLAVAGVWIVEFAEMDVLSRAETSRIKSFLSRNSDHYRSPYGRLMEDHPRQCVFASTVNRSDYGNDETGLRRYWPVACGAIDLQALGRDRDQLWAEALERYRLEESWWFEDARLETAAEKEQEERQRDDPWDTIVADWLFTRDEPMSTAMVLAGALKKEIGQWSQADKIRVGGILRRLGRIPKKIRGGPRLYYSPEDEEKKGDS